MGLAKVGDTVGQRYRLDRIIAYGGMATVFEAEHLVTGRRLALKRPLPKYEGDREVHRRLLGEGRALGFVRHPNVVEIHDAGTAEDGGAYLALELLAGKTLRGVLAARGQLSAAMTARVGVTLCEALAFAHRRGVIHRDVRPDNMFAVVHGGAEVLKLFDFGTAAVEGAGDEPLDPEQADRGGLMGTIEYIAPELMLNSEDLSSQVDVYAVGVTLFECLTGSVPFEGHAARVMHQALTQAPPPIVERCPDVPAPLAAAVDRALARDRSVRYRTLPDLRRALLEAWPEPSPVAAPVPANAPRPEASPPTQRSPEAMGGDAPIPVASIPVAPIPVTPISVAPSSVAPISLAPSSLVFDEQVAVQRRRYPRVACVMPLTVQKDDGTELTGHSEDVSEQGIRALVSGALRAGERTIVRFTPPGSYEPVTLSAAVAWVRAARGTHVVGFELRDAPGVVRDRLRGFVEAEQTSRATPWVSVGAADREAIPTTLRPADLRRRGP